MGYKMRPKSPMMKKLVGNQHKLPAHLKQAILDSPAKMKDLSGDGKITKKDVLIGRGVLKKDSPMDKHCFKKKGCAKCDNGKKSCVCGKSPAKLKDACYYKAKRAHKVFPSAYASGMIAKCRKNKGKKK